MNRIQSIEYIKCDKVIKVDERASRQSSMATNHVPGMPVDTKPTTLYRASRKNRKINSSIISRFNWKITVYSKWSRSSLFLRPESIVSLSRRTMRTTWSIEAGHKRRLDTAEKEMSAWWRKTLSNFHGSRISKKRKANEYLWAIEKNFFSLILASFFSSCFVLSKARTRSSAYSPVGECHDDVPIVVPKTADYIARSHQLNQSRSSRSFTRLSLLNIVIVVDSGHLSLSVAKKNESKTEIETKAKKWIMSKGYSWIRETRLEITRGAKMVEDGAIVVDTTIHSKATKKSAPPTGKLDESRHFYTTRRRS